MQLKMLMTTEDELEKLWRDARQNEDEDEECGQYSSVDTQDSNDLATDLETTGDIRHIVSPLLDHDEIDKKEGDRRKKATMLVPGNGERYKSTAIAELRNNPKLWTDRLRSIRNAIAVAREAN